MKLKKRQHSSFLLWNTVVVELYCGEDSLQKEEISEERDDRWPS